MVLGSYGYRYLEAPRAELLRLMSIGRDSIAEPEYFWDGMKREGDGVIFQYTLSGEGRLAVGNQTYRVAKGQAFLVTVPGRHRYYYESSAAEAWEFLWIRLSGAQVSAVWEEWLGAEGPVADFRSDSETIVKLAALYEDAAAGAFQDMWEVSVRLYDWLLTLLRRMVESPITRNAIPESFSRTAVWMETHYSQDISLDQLAEMANVTKHHYCRKFQDYYRTTPIHYLRRKRVEAAAFLLRQSCLPIGEIAGQCGFTDLGYFGKVFRQLVGTSPSNYRLSRMAEPGDNLKLL
ncbi:AraC family transcriptional regulator [Paenibacillus contaminans]|uniref:AraC family transcriptional regulator n=1 Tax=Paenibacillus contaminans TaxID=450362 RepID=A0A329M4J8_9BACL|nr:AraC family transcriptional regulator [Paenibacillus contaminans]RAV14814.1 AraC family transcriptional regulator [Paenibacillus contaminans]